MSPTDADNAPVVPYDDRASVHYGRQPVQTDEPDTPPRASAIRQLHLRLRRRVRRPAGPSELRSRS